MQNVLIVEDDNLQAGMLSTTISQKYPDWTITHTDNLEQALKIIDDSVHTINFTLFLLDLSYCLLSTLCRGQLAPGLEDALPLCPFGTFPHTVGNHPRRAEPARPQLPAARIFEPLCKFIRSFLLLFPANPLGLPVQFLRHPLPFLQSDCTLLFHRVLFG